jgi:hypothetical protein
MSAKFEQDTAGLAAVAAEAVTRAAADTVLTTSVGYQSNYVGQRVLGLMQSDQCSVNVAFVTDSVGAESYWVSGTGSPLVPVEWCYKLTQTWAAAYPAYTVNFYALDQSAHKDKTVFRVERSFLWIRVVVMPPLQENFL